MPTTTITVGAKYLIWAHEPAAESGHRPAQRLVDLCNGRRLVRVPLGDEELRRELHCVADLYCHAETREADPDMYRVAKRIMRILGPYGKRRNP
ncbi:MAG: hypothetical protein QN204_05005 [Armatimonadota bacterium]|nr:hypothetical protein [Armatimonadota bacterium]